MLFQKLFMFLIKITIFPICLLFYSLYVWISKYNCYCRPPENIKPVDWYSELGLDPAIQTSLSIQNFKLSTKDFNESHFTHKEFVSKRYYKTRTKCLTLRRRFYVLRQLCYLMYHDSNKYVMNQTCEYCNEQFVYLEKIIFPNNCKNHPENFRKQKFLVQRRPTDTSDLVNLKSP